MGGTSQSRTLKLLLYRYHSLRCFIIAMEKNNCYSYHVGEFSLTKLKHLMPYIHVIAGRPRILPDTDLHIFALLQEGQRFFLKQIFIYSPYCLKVKGSSCYRSANIHRIAGRPRALPDTDLHFTSSCSSLTL